MAEVIEFEIPTHFTPKIKWPPTDQKRGKIIPFLSHREASDEAVCAPYEELDSESSQPLRLGRIIFECNGESIFDLVHFGLSPTVAQFGHEMRAEYLTSTGSFTVPFLFWTNGTSVIRPLQSGWVIGGFNGASARSLLEPLGTKAVSESYESLIL